MSSLWVCLVSLMVIAGFMGVMPKVARPGEIVARLKHLPGDIKVEVKSDFRSLSWDYLGMRRQVLSTPIQAKTIFHRIDSEARAMTADVRDDAREIARSLSSDTGDSR
jgi:hypothetical protein